MKTPPDFFFFGLFVFQIHFLLALGRGGRTTMWMPDRFVDLMEKKDGWTGADTKLGVRRGINSHQQMTFLVFCASSDK